VSNQLRIIYAGTPDFSVAALSALIASEHQVIAVYTQPDRPAGRGRGSHASPVKQKALENNIPVFQPGSLKDEAAQEELNALNADLMVVTAYGLLLPAAVLDMPRLGCINIHASLLPRWRGAAPIQRAILAGDKKTGITIMQMDEGLDTGAMLCVAECEITAKETGSSLHDGLMVLGAKTLMAVLPEIAAGTCARVRQSDDGSCYAAKLSKAEAKINWHDPAEKIEREVRAYNAWPVAYCQYEKNNKLTTMRVWQAEIAERSNVASDVEPGKVIAQSLQGIDVVTGAGVIRITQLQVEGKRQMSAADFLNANSLLAQVLT